MIRISLIYEQTWKTTYQNSRSYNSPEVPGLIRNVIIFVSRFSSRKEQQDVTEHTKDGQRNQRDAQALGKTPGAHFLFQSLNNTKAKSNRSKKKKTSGPGSSSAPRSRWSVPKWCTREFIYTSVVWCHNVGSDLQHLTYNICRLMIHLRNVPALRPVYSR